MIVAKGDPLCCHDFDNKLSLILPSIENTEDFLVLGTNAEELRILDVVSEDWEIEII